MMPCLRLFPQPHPNSLQIRKEYKVVYLKNENCLQAYHPEFNIPQFHLKNEHGLSPFDFLHCLKQIQKRSTLPICDCCACGLILSFDAILVKELPCSKNGQDFTLTYHQGSETGTGNPLLSVLCCQAAFQQRNSTPQNSSEVCSSVHPWPAFQKRSSERLNITRKLAYLKRFLQMKCFVQKMK